MADSPTPSAPQSNIDDLVKELSRPQGSSPAPASPSVPSVNPAPAPSMPTRPMTPPPIVPSPAPLPPKPITTPTPAPVVPSAPKEYQSSIRTMSDDLSKLKAGQQPQGVSIPRKVDNTPLPTKPVSPTIPAPAPTKSQISATLPSANKSSSLPFTPAPVTNTPAPAPKPQVSAPIPRPVMPAMPPATKAPEIKSDTKNQFYVPPTATKPAGGSGSASRNLLFAGIAVVVVLLGGLYWYFMIQGSTNVTDNTPVVTFTPRPSATPTPNLDVLSTIFTNHGSIIVLPAQGNPMSAVINGVKGEVTTPGSFVVAPLSISPIASSTPQIIGLVDLFDRSAIGYPTNIKQALGGRYNLLAYGQKENFDAKGHALATPVPSNRIVIVSELTAPASASLKLWESTMDNSSTGIGKLLGIDPAKNTKSFQDNMYKGVAVRFKNYQYPDHAIDYGTIQYGGKTYLIFAGSREAMFAAIDAFSFSVPGK